jgi:hypothetical protein
LEHESAKAKVKGAAVHHLTSELPEGVRQLLLVSHTLEGDVIGSRPILFVLGRVKWN